MAVMLADNPSKVVFQCDMAARLQRINKVDYAVFEGEHVNGPAKIAFTIRMKQGFLKKQGVDLIKNSHMVLQKRNPLFFFLFEADKTAFVTKADGVELFEENERTKNYDYKISIRMDRNIKEEKKESRIGGTAGEKLAELEEFMRQKGITEADPSSPVSEYMKSWKLGHPDER